MRKVSSQGFHKIFLHKISLNPSRQGEGAEEGRRVCVTKANEIPAKNNKLSEMKNIKEHPKKKAKEKEPLTFSVPILLVIQFPFMFWPFLLLFLVAFRLLLPVTVKEEEQEQ